MRFRLFPLGLSWATISPSFSFLNLFPVVCFGALPEWPERHRERCCPSTVGDEAVNPSC